MQGPYNKATIMFTFNVMKDHMVCVLKSVLKVDSIETCTKLYHAIDICLYFTDFITNNMFLHIMIF